MGVSDISSGHTASDSMLPLWELASRFDRHTSRHSRRALVLVLLGPVPVLDLDLDDPGSDTLDELGARSFYVVLDSFR